MAYDARVFRVLVASPNDVDQERDIIARAIQEWNDLNSYEKSVVLLPLMWETHSSPELGDRPQAIINRQLVDSCDMLVGVFWTRIGTPTGEAESGTIEEIERVGKAGKFVMLYFSKIKVELDSVDLDQYKKLKEFKYKTYPRGLVESYSSLLEFRDKFSKQLAMKLPELVTRDVESQASTVGLDATIPKIELALVHVETDKIIPSGSSLEIQKIICSDKDRIFELFELMSEKYNDGSTKDIMRYYYAKLESYFNELIDFYCAKSCYNDFRLAINNIGDLGVRDLISEIDLTEKSENLVLCEKGNLPLRRPNKPTKPNLQHDKMQIINGDVTIGNISGGSTYFGGLSGDIEVSREDSGWDLKFEVPVVQPQRIVISNSIFQIGVQESCKITFNGNVFSSESKPFRMNSSFDLVVLTKQMTYKEILSHLDEDIPDF